MRNITRQEYGFATSIADVVRYLLGVFLLLRQIADGNIRTFSCEGDRRGAANAGVGSREQRFATARRPVPL